MFNEHCIAGSLLVHVFNGTTFMPQADGKRDRITNGACVPIVPSGQRLAI
jgi:hypothetical protein